MPSLKALKRRIHSVQSTRKITSAMKMVATSYYRRYQLPLVSARAFVDGIKSAMALVKPALPLDCVLPTLLTGRKAQKNSLIIAIGATRGLCGSFNTRLLQEVHKKQQDLKNQNQAVTILCLGARLYNLIKTQCAADQVWNLPVDYKNLEGFSQILCETLKTLFSSEKIDQAFIVYSFHQSALSSEVRTVPLFPNASLLDQPPTAEGENLPNDHAIFAVEPDPETFITTALTSLIQAQLYSALLESKASEESTRMIAMENATKNADEMIRTLNIDYNRTRQAQITKELIEIISGAEAL